MDVAGQHARALEHIALAAADLHILAGLREKHLVVVGQRLLDVLALERHFGRIGDELDERIRLRHEVGLAVDFRQGH